MTFIEQFFQIVGERTNKYLSHRKNRDKLFANRKYEEDKYELLEEIQRNTVFNLLIKDSRTTDEFLNSFKISSIQVDKVRKEIFVNMDLLTNLLTDLTSENFDALLNLQPMDIFTYSQIKSLKSGSFSHSEKEKFKKDYNVYIKVTFNKHDMSSSFNFVDDFNITSSHRGSKAQIVITNGILVNGFNPVFAEFDKKIENIQKIIYGDVLNIDLNHPVFKNTGDINEDGVMLELDKFSPEILENFNIDEEILNTDDSNIIWKKNKIENRYYKSDS